MPETTPAPSTPAAPPLPDPLLEVVGAGLQIVDLGRPLFVGMPQSPNHPEYRHALPRRHGDAYRSDGSSAANDIVVTGTHVGTHVDALSHVSYQGHLHGDLDADAAQRGGRFSALGIETMAPLVCPGVLLDIPDVLGKEACEPGYEITPDDLERAAALTPPIPGGVILVRSGWGRHFEDPALFVGRDSGVPGVSEAGAHWLAAYRPPAVGADTIAFEMLPPGAGHALLPAHRVLLVEQGIHIIETMDLEELSRRRIRRFTFVLAPLPLVGATGSPVRPLALVPASPADGKTAPGSEQAGPK